MNKSYQRRNKDLAHAPGHRRLNIEGTHEDAHGKVQPQNESALNRMADSERIFRNESTQRREGRRG